MPLLLIAVAPQRAIEAFAHGSYGALDEIIPIVMVAIVVVILATVVGGKKE